MPPPINIITTKPSPYAITIDQYSPASASIYKYRELLQNSSLWHKICVHNCQDADRRIILKTIMDVVYPYDFIPVYYMQEENGTAHFLVRNCELAIEKLCKDCLVMGNPVNPNKSLKLSIVLHYSTLKEITVDISKNISSVLFRRHTVDSLNLDAFVDDPDLVEFCALSQPKLLSYVIQMSKVFKPKTLILSNNDIHSLEVLVNLDTMKYPQYLDLRNNRLESVNELQYIKPLKITDLWLEGNPLCEKYNENEYVQTIREFCPKIERIDGVLLRQHGFPSFRRNFLCTSCGHDVVDQFLETYFLAYDSGQNRTILKDLYHKNAMFSMTAQYFSMQMSSSNAQMKRYLNSSRNLISLADLSRCEQHLYQGNKSITDFLSTLPGTEHDPYSFTVDLIYFTSSCAIIVVTGVFREVPDKLLDVSERILGFNRIFILESNSTTMEYYYITNEQLHVFNALTIQQVKAFKQPKTLRSENLPNAQTVQQKTDMINAFKQITSLTTDLAKKYLEGCQYNLKEGIIQFVEDYKLDKVPMEGFQN